MNIHQKESERFILDEFKKLLPDFPKGKITTAESPDFVVQSGPKYKTGIEIVSLKVSKHEQGQSNNLENLLEELIEKKNAKMPLYQKRNLNAYWLIIYSKQFKGFVHQNRKSFFDRLHVESLFNNIWCFDIDSLEIYQLSP